MALREIFAHFGFDFDRAALGRVNQAVEGVKKNAKAAGGREGIGGLVEGLKGALLGFVGSEAVRKFGELAEAADQFADLSEQIGLNTDTLQAWQYAVKLNGADTADFATGLKKLSMALEGSSADSATTLEMFKKLGVATKDAGGNVKSLEDLVPEIADGFAGLKSQTERAALATQLFGRSGSKMSFLLSQGADGLAQFREEFEALGGGFSGDAIKAASEYNDSIDRIRYSFRALGSQLLIHLGPQLADLLNGFARGVASFSSWIKETTALQTAIGTLAAFLTNKLLLALAPFLLPGLKFLAIFLAVDDLVAFLRGQDSVIGAILNDWFGADFTNDVRSTFANVGTIAKGTLEGIGDLWRALTADSEAEQDKWVSRFLGSTDNMTRAIDNWFMFCALGFANIAGKFNGMVLQIESAWNAMINDLAGSLAKISGQAADAFKAGFSVDMTGAIKNVAANAATVSALRNNIENNKDKIAGVSTPTAVNYGPVRAPSVSTNYVELNAPVTVTLPAGVSPGQARELSRQAQKGGADAYRAAVQSLEQRVSG